MCLLGCFFLFLFFFEEIEFTANAKTLMQVSPSTTAMQKLHASCMPGRLLVPTFDVITAQMPATVLNIVLNS